MMVQSHSHSHSGDDRMPRRPVVHLQPNVIARLMGIDDAVVPTPPPANPVASGVGEFQAQRRRRRQTNKRSSLQLNDDAECTGSGSGSSSRICLHKMMMVVPRSRSRSSRPRRRLHRHPQEEELLQKMRHDLQAWQASKAPALPSDSDGGGRSSLVLQAIAQEDLRRQKMARYGFGFGFNLGAGHSNLTQQDGHHLMKNNNENKNGSVAQGEGDPSSSERAAAEQQAAAMPDDDSVVVATAPSQYHRAAATAPAAQGHQDLPSHGHTPIVLLKPAATCSESDTATATGGVAIGAGQKTSVSFLGLPKLHRDANMSMLLQEVKNRVQRELALTAATAAGSGPSGEVSKTPTSGWAIPPLQQATRGKEDRGNKRRLFRSQSFRAFRRDRKRNASPEAYSLKSETAVSPPEKADGEESLTDAALSSVLRPGVGAIDGQSFRSECLTTKHSDESSLSPQLLFRSLSAPESGFAFSLGRLFSSKQHQASDEPAAAARVTSNSVVSAGFSSFIRGTVSSLRRHGFSSRRNLLMFRRKTHWSWSNKTASLGAGEIHPAKMEVSICPATSPTHETFNLFKVAQASLSELPPSPVSPLEVAVGHSSRHFFTDLHFTLPSELSPKCLSEFEAPPTASESSFRTDTTAVEAAWSRDKAYITELLIAAGLYDDDDDGPSLDHNKQANTRVDSMARPMAICDDVFEDVEDMYYYRGDYIVAGGGDMCSDGTDHRMLFDLANEALQRLVVESTSSRGGASSSLRQWIVDSTGVSRGKKLVDDVWQQVQTVRNNPEAHEMQTIEGMVAYEVRRSVWTQEVVYEDVYVVGRKIERAIFDELIQDVTLPRNVEFHMM